MGTDTKVLIASLLGDGEVIAFRPAIARALRSATSALFLCQAAYWQSIAGAGKWWYKLRDAERDQDKKMVPPTNKSKQSWEWETGLTRAQQEDARTHLRELGLLEERRAGVPARLYYRVNLDELEKFLLQLVEFRRPEGVIELTGRQDSADLSARLTRQVGNKEPAKPTKTRQQFPNNNNTRVHAKTDVVACNEAKNSQAYTRLLAHGIGEELAREWVQRDEKRVLEVLDYVEDRLRNNEVRRSASGYIRVLMENSATGFGKSQFGKQLDEEKQAKKNAEAEVAANMQRLQVVEEERRQFLRQAIKNLTLEQRQEHAQRYIEGQGASYSKSYRAEKADFVDPKEEIMFIGWLTSQLPTSTI